jgi:hypothetical protein
MELRLATAKLIQIVLAALLALGTSQLVESMQRFELATRLQRKWALKATQLTALPLISANQLRQAKLMEYQRHLLAMPAVAA